MQVDPQTTAILVACIVYLVRQIVEGYKLMHGLSDRRMLEDLYRWHKPQTDIASGQPYFPWYADSAAIRLDVQALSKTVADLRSQIEQVKDE